MAFFYSIILIIFKIINNENNESDNILFNSIKGDSYNLTEIYHYNYENIKIKFHRQN